MTLKSRLKKIVLQRVLHHQEKRKQEDFLVAHVVSQEELLLKKQKIYTLSIIISTSPMS